MVQPFALSNGQVLPAGVIVEAPNGPISSDPEIYFDPHVFDPLRFYKIRQAKDAVAGNSGVKKAELVANSQFVSSGSLSLSWGYGRHACPGRFFAANEVKMIVGKVLMEYELKLPDGVTERYPNFTYGDMVGPSFSSSSKNTCSSLTHTDNAGSSQDGNDKKVHCRQGIKLRGLEMEIVLKYVYIKR